MDERSPYVFARVAIETSKRKIHERMMITYCAHDFSVEVRLSYTSPTENMPTRNKNQESTKRFATYQPIDTSAPT